MRAEAPPRDANGSRPQGARRQGCGKTVVGDVIVRVEDVDAGYDGVAILERIRFEVRRGEVFGILGGSGCGKSTLMEHMIGLNPPIAGHVFIGDDDIVTAADEQLEAIQRSFGVMYQSGALFGSMTLLENVRLPLEIYTTFRTTPSISSRG